MKVDLVNRSVLVLLLLILVPAVVGMLRGGEARLLYHYALAEKSEMYTSSEEFLPLGVDMGENEEGIDTSFLEDNTIIHNAFIGGIKLFKEENRLIFILSAENPEDIEGKGLKFDTLSLNFPPRFILRLYGVVSEDLVFRFFKNLNIIGIILNPFKNMYISEYIVFFEDWVEVTAMYSETDNRLILEYTFTEPEYRRGFGVRIADTKIDPLPHIVEIKKELTKYGLENHLLVATDHETVVLESPFYSTREEAIEYMESLEGFGYKGKLAIREYREFPKPHRFDVVSEVVITAEDDINLESIVYTELIPEKIHTLSYAEIYLITKAIFSPRVQDDDELISEYYYKLSEIYQNYHTFDEDGKRMSWMVAIKLLEIIYFNYPETQWADDALWGIANTIREVGVENMIGEEECYRKIIDEYPESVFLDESIARIGGESERATSKIYRGHGLRNYY